MATTRMRLYYNVVPVLLCAAAVCWCFSRTARCQDLELDTYRIVGKDTRVFTIEGDRLSTVRYVPVPLVLPEEERELEASEGLIDNEERFVRGEIYGTTTGPYIMGSLRIGAETLADFWTKAGIDLGSTAGVLDTSVRMVEENTPFNSAPFVREFNATGYHGGLGARMSASLGVRGDSEKLLGDRFRFRDRNMNMVFAAASFSTPLGGWDADARAEIGSGSFRDDDISCDEDEFDFDGSFNLTGEIYDITLVSDTGVSYMKFGGDSGTVVTTGLKGMLLLFNDFSFFAGADMHVLTLGDVDTEYRLYPNAGFEWALTRSLYARASFKPSVDAYSRRRLFDRNGLIDAVPYAVEDKKIALDGEIGWRFIPQSLLKAAFFDESVDNALIFNRSGALFSIVPGADINVTGFRAGIEFDTGRWGVDGDMEIRDVSWNFTGDVPYMPAFQSVVDGRYNLYGKWNLTGCLSFYGDHYVEAGSDATEDGFMTIDLGAERELMKHVRASIQFRNITNADGAWWTSRYRIPGAGLFASVSAEY